MKVILLAGGLGTRLAEETSIRPKPMVEIGGMPILWHIMKIYAHYGFNDFVIALGYKGEVIKDFFLNYKPYKSDMMINLVSGQVMYENIFSENWNVGLYDTGIKSMTGGRLLRLKRLFSPDDTFLLTYGDGVSDINLNKLIEFHQAHGKIATMTAVRPPARFGSILTEESGKIIEFQEKPQTGEGWINGGFFVFNYKIFDYLLDDSTVLEKYPLEQLSRDNELVAFKHDGFWQCMDTVRDRDSLNEMYSNGQAPWINFWS